MKIPFLVLVLQGIPEQIGIVTLAFVIAKASLDWGKIISSGVFLAVSAYLLRMLPITFGVHTIVLIGFLFFILFKFAKVNLTTSIVTSIVSFLALIVFETVSLSILMPLFNITHDLFISNVIIRVLITIPQVLLIYLTAYLIKKLRN